jgi:hypothetical protein
MSEGQGGGTLAANSLLPPPLPAQPSLLHPFLPDFLSTKFFLLTDVSLDSDLRFVR